LVDGIGGEEKFSSKEWAVPKYGEKKEKEKKQKKEKQEKKQGAILSLRPCFVHALSGIA
jgi:hypothetical protein